MVQIISTNSTASIALLAGEDYFLLPGIAHSPTGTAITPADSSDIYIDGSLVSLGGAAIFGASGGVRITIGANGSVYGSQSSYLIGAVSNALDNLILTNHGVMSGGIIGAQDNFRYVNTGEFSYVAEVGRAAVEVAGSNAVIQNSGTITSFDLVGVEFELTSSGTARVQNSGTISADIAAISVQGGSTAALILTNSGVITSGTNAVLAEDQADRVTNTGLLDGDVVLAGGADVVSNTGTIAGLLNLGSEGDRYVGSGDALVTGQVLGDSGNDTLIGGALSDDMDGGADNDTLRGNGGNDTLAGGTGDDNIAGGDGNDDLLGGDNDDFMGGNAGDDLLDGEAGNDTLRGANGDDTLRGRDGDDRIVGGAGNDVADGGGNNDDVSGGSGEDVLNGNAGDDTVRGGTDNDSVSGSSGADILFGNDGDDVITGGLQRDVLFGGRGADSFVFTTAADSDTAGADRDVIRDFEQGTDLIDLAQLTGPVLTFVGAGGFTGGGTGSVRAINQGGNSVVQIDVDGDGSADSGILVSGVINLTADDFVL